MEYVEYVFIEQCIFHTIKRITIPFEYTHVTLPMEHSIAQD